MTICLILHFGFESKSILRHNILTNESSHKKPTKKESLIQFLKIKETIINLTIATCIENGVKVSFEQNYRNKNLTKNLENMKQLKLDTLK